MLIATRSDLTVPPATRNGFAASVIRQNLNASIWSEPASRQQYSIASRKPIHVARVNAYFRSVPCLQLRIRGDAKNSSTSGTPWPSVRSRNGCPERVPCWRAHSDKDGSPASTGSSTTSADEPAGSHQNTCHRQRPTIANHRIGKHHARDPKSVKSIATTTLHWLETLGADLERRPVAE